MLQECKSQAESTTHQHIHLLSSHAWSCCAFRTGERSLPGSCVTKILFNVALGLFYGGCCGGTSFVRTRSTQTSQAGSLGKGNSLLLCFICDLFFHARLYLAATHCGWRTLQSLHQCNASDLIFCPPHADASHSAQQKLVDACTILRWMFVASFIAKVRCGKHAFV